MVDERIEVEAVYEITGDIPSERLLKGDRIYQLSTGDAVMIRQHPREILAGIQHDLVAMPDISPEVIRNRKFMEAIERYHRRTEG